MKKALVLLTTVMSCILFSSCDSTDGGERDRSLAGSISFRHYFITAAGTYDGTLLEYLQRDGSHLSIEKLSDTEVSLECVSEWGEETNFKISIPYIPVSGVPDNAALDYTSTEVVVIHNETEYTSVGTSIKGWIKEENFEENKNTRSNAGLDIYMPSYNCDIEIECTLDGKKLIITITSATY